MTYLPADLVPPPSETREEQFVRRTKIAGLIRRRRRLAGLTFRQVAQAALMDASRVSRYEQGWQYPGPEAIRRVLEAIDRLEREGVGNPERAHTARRDYEAEEEAGEAR